MLRGPYLFSSLTLKERSKKENSSEFIVLICNLQANWNKVDVMVTHRF